MERALEAFVGRTPRRSQGGGITCPPDRVLSRVGFLGEATCEGP